MKNQKTGRNAETSVHNGATNWSNDLLSGLQMLAVGANESQQQQQQPACQADCSKQRHRQVRMEPRTIITNATFSARRAAQCADSCFPVGRTGQCFSVETTEVAEIFQICLNLVS